MPTVSDDAVCIRHWDWSETSQTVSLFARRLGVLRGIAKGAKRENSRFSGGFEVLTRGAVIAIVKGGEGLATLTAWDLQETFPAVRRSLPAFYAGMYLADLVHHAVRDADPHPALYDALVDGLRALVPSQDLHRAVLRFQWAALVETGYKPELLHDVRTGAPLAPAEWFTFIPGMGGLVQADAGHSGGPGQRGGPFWRVRGATVEALRALEQAPGRESALHTHADAASEKTLARANRLLAFYWREVLGAEPPSMTHYLSVLDQGVRGA